MIKIILYPFSLIYGSITAVRNLMFSLGILKSVRFPVPVICVGNITVGGTGKTPFVEYLISILQQHKVRVAVLSRGYRRKTQGWVLSDALSTADQIGDEPCQMKQKYPQVQVAVCEKRVIGIENLLALADKPELIVLDDAFQHRAVDPLFTVLLMDYNRPLWRDTPFPGGRLREFASNRTRASVVVVTKCPQNITSETKQYIIKRLHPVASQNIFFSSIEYASVRQLWGQKLQTPSSTRIIALTGIAVPAPFIAQLSQSFTLVDHLQYPDHHHFSDADIASIAAKAQHHAAPIITTEKDAMRLKQYFEALQTVEIWYLPITICIDREEELVRRVLSCTA